MKWRVINMNYKRNIFQTNNIKASHSCLLRGLNKVKLKQQAVPQDIKKWILIVMKYIFRLHNKNNLHVAAKIVYHIRARLYITFIHNSRPLHCIMIKFNTTSFSKMNTFTYTHQKIFIFLSSIIFIFYLLKYHHHNHYHHIILVFSLSIHHVYMID